MRRVFRESESAEIFRRREKRPRIVDGNVERSRVQRFPGNRVDDAHAVPLCGSRRGGIDGRSRPETAGDRPGVRPERVFRARRNLRVFQRHRRSGVARREKKLAERQKRRFPQTQFLGRNFRAEIPVRRQKKRLRILEERGFSVALGKVHGRGARRLFLRHPKRKSRRKNHEREQAERHDASQPRLRHRGQAVAEKPVNRERRNLHAARFVHLRKFVD